MKASCLVLLLVLWSSANLFGLSAIIDDVTTQRVITVKFQPEDSYPQQIRFAVKPENVENKPWVPFTTNGVQVDLGTNDGLKTISLRFQSTVKTGSGTQTSGGGTEYKIWLNPTPNVFTVTEPTQPFITQPMIQIKGFTPWEIMELQYAVLDQNGVTTTSADGIVNDRYFDKNLWDYTTNYFTLYDVQLNPGTNVIRLQAKDVRTEKLMTTNLTYVFGTQTVKSGPQLAVDHPQDGECISDQPLSIRGNSDDPTAKITGLIALPSGEIIRRWGQVERNGRYWIDNVPVTDGRTYVTIVANNAANYTTITNFSFRKSSYELKMDPIPSNLLWLPKVTVTGTSTCNPSNYTILINNVKATLDASGRWRAENVPTTEGGVAIFDIKAIPNSGHDECDDPDPLPAVPIIWNDSANEIKPGLYLHPGDTNHFNPYQFDFYLANTTGTNMNSCWMRPAGQSLLSVTLCDTNGNALTNISSRRSPDDSLPDMLSLHHLYAQDLDGVDGVLELITNVPVHVASFEVLDRFYDVPPGDYQIKVAARLYQITHTGKLTLVKLAPATMPLTIYAQPSRIEFQIHDLEKAGRFVWGKSTNSVQAGLAFNFPSQQHDAKAQIEIYLLNSITNNSQVFRSPVTEEQFDMSLRDAHNKEVPKTEQGLKIGKPLSTDDLMNTIIHPLYGVGVVYLPANQPMQWKRLNLSDYFQISTPGKYTLTYRQRLLMASANKVFAKLYLPPITVQVNVQWQR